MKLIYLRIAAHEAGEAARRGDLKACPGHPRPDDLVDLHRMSEPFDGEAAKRLHLDVAFGEAQRVSGDQDRARLRHLLHARGKVRRLADRRVVHAQIAADGSHHDLARIQADADLQGYLRDGVHVARVLLHRLLHEQRGVTGAGRVVLVRKRCAEERHDAVAHHLVDSALVPMHGVHQPLENRVEDRARLFGITVFQQFHGTLEVGEEHGDLFALTLHGALRRQDLIDEVLRRVCVGRGESWRRARGRVPALRTEVRGGVNLATAGRAARGQPQPAPAAELGVGRVLV